MSSQDQLESNQKFINRFDFVNGLINDIKDLDKTYSLQASGSQLDSQGKLLNLFREDRNDADFNFIITAKRAALLTDCTIASLELVVAGIVQNDFEIVDSRSNNVLQLNISGELDSDIRSLLIEYLPKINSVAWEINESAITAKHGTAKYGAVDRYINPIT